MKRKTIPIFFVLASIVVLGAFALFAMSDKNDKNGVQNIVSGDSQRSSGTASPTFSPEDVPKPLPRWDSSAPVASVSETRNQGNISLVAGAQPMGAPRNSLSQGITLTPATVPDRTTMSISQVSNMVSPSDTIPSTVPPFDSMTSELSMSEMTLPAVEIPRKQSLQTPTALPKPPEGSQGLSGRANSTSTLPPPPPFPTPPPLNPPPVDTPSSMPSSSGSSVDLASDPLMNPSTPLPPTPLMNPPMEKQVNPLATGSHHSADVPPQVSPQQDIDHPLQEQTIPSGKMDIQYDGATIKTSPGTVPMNPSQHLPQHQPTALPMDSTADPTADMPMPISNSNRIARIPESSEFAPDFTIPGTSAGTSALQGTALPGPRHTEGGQTSQLTIEKQLPPEVPMNEIVTMKIVIRNNGGVLAKNVVLTDRIPKGTRLEETSPQAVVSPQGDLVWELGDIDFHGEKIVEVRVMPIEEGEFGSVATVTFSVDSSAKTLVTKPGLEMTVRTAEQSYLVGSNVVFEIVLSNPGTGMTDNIVLEEFVPEGLSHSLGRKLSSPIGSLRPGETKHLKVTMQGVSPGEVINHIIATASGGLVVENKTPVVILAPRLDIAIDGPKMRYLERKAVYQLTIGNSGSAAARDVKLAVQLPEGVDFVSTDSSGVYDPSKHMVHWALEELPIQQSGNIELVALPKKAGDYQIMFRGEAEGGLHEETVHDMSIQGIAALCFEVADLAGPVEVGRNTVYEIRVANQGTKATQNVVVNVQLSTGMEFVEASAPVPHHVSNGSVTFNSLPGIGPKEEEQIYKVKVRCLESGDHRIRVQVQSEDLQQPITKEVSTKVFGDE